MRCAGSRSLALAAIVALAACGTGSARAPAGPDLSNHAAASARPALTVRVSDIHGWLAFATARPDDATVPDWLPRTPQPGLILPTPPAPFAPAVELRAIPSTGAAIGARAGAPGTIPYGCDNGTLEIITIAPDAAVASGVTWLLPTPLPAGWQPRGVEVRAGDATANARTFVAGALTISLARVDPDRARLAIATGGRTISSSVFVRTPYGDPDPAPLDLRSWEPGIPSPVAAYEVAPGGPTILVLATPGLEGLNLSALLVTPDGGGVVPELTAYLYQCAF